MSAEKLQFETSSDGLDEALNKCEESLQSKGTGDRNYYKMKEGAEGNKFRIMPPLAGQTMPWFHVKVHFGLMGKDGKKMAILCGYCNFDSCPLCREADLYRSQGDNLKAWNIAAKDYYLYNVVDDQGNFAVLSADKRTQEELIKIFKFARSEDGGKFNPWDLKDGCYIKVIKTKGTPTEKQKYPPNKYAAHLLVRKPLEDELLEAAPTSVHNLTEVYRVFKPEEIEGILNGTFDPYADRKDKKVESKADELPPLSKAEAKTESAPPPQAKKVSGLSGAIDDLKTNGNIDDVAASILQDDDGSL